VKEDNKPPAPPPWRRWLRTALVCFAWLAAGILLTSLIALLVRDSSPPHFTDPSPPVPEVRFEKEGWQELPPVHMGGQGTLPLRLVRKNFDGPVKLIPDELPKDVKVKAEAGPGEDLTVSAQVGVDAVPGRYRIVWHAEGTPSLDLLLILTVIYLPKGYQPGGEPVKDHNDVPYYPQLQLPWRDQGPIEFVLVVRDKSNTQPQSGVETFYISRYKITYGQFRAFADEHSKDVSDDKWRKLGENAPMQVRNRLPVRDVTVTDAYRFAKEIGGRAGHLPNLDQWDKAAGFWHATKGHDPYWKGPYKGKWSDRRRPRVAVNLPQPVAVDDSKDEDDVSWYGCQGMAGNGEEWTRTLYGGKEVPPENPRPEDRVILRGWSFNMLFPATFELLHSSDRSEGYTETHTNLGFRVVLEPPKKD
jgi:hypothetical protein